MGSINNAMATTSKPRARNNMTRAFPEDGEQDAGDAGGEARIVVVTSGKVKEMGKATNTRNYMLAPPTNNFFGYFMASSIF
jgi:hypothetical protein